MEIIHLDQRDNRHVCARNSKAIIEYILRFYGSNLLPKIFDQILDQKKSQSHKYYYQGKPIDLSYFENIENWYSNEINLKLFQNIDAVGINLKDVGRFSIKNSNVSNNITIIGMLHILGPAKTAKKVNEINAFFNKTKQVELVSFRNGKGIIKLKYDSRFRHTQLVTQQNIGVYEGVWEAVGFPRVEINVLEDDYSPGGHTTLEFIWNPTSFFKKLRWITGLAVTRLFAKTYAKSNHCIEHYHSDLISHYQNEIRQRVANLKERDLLNEQLQLEKTLKEKELEEKIQAKTKKLRLAYESQNKIYSSISHTTRTPLTNLLHPLNELKTGNPFKPEWTDMMIRQGEQLKNNFQNLIDISRLQSGEKIRWGAHEVAPLLKSLQQDFQIQASKKLIQLRVDDQTSRLTAVKSYEQSLTIIMNNLLENAIKHTPEKGSIMITASEQKTHVVIAVIDTGSGIKQEEMEQIFKYGQSDHKKSGWQPAGGIGLYTCANVAKALNGTLSAENSAQGGAIFTLKLPKADGSTKNRIEARKSDKYTQQKSTQKIINSKNTGKPQILLLDDNPDILYTLSEQLQDHYQIITSIDAEKALTIIAEQIPDLIVSDVMMPQINGFDFLQRIRSNSLTEDCPVIMLTAMGEKTAQLQLLQLKADAVLSKPHDKDRLLLTIENLLLKRTQAYFKAQLEFENYLLNKNETQESGTNIYQKIIEYLEENYHENNLNVETLARALGISVATFSRKLKKITHTKPLEIINTVRVKKAKHFIKQGADFIDVAYDCGFSSQQAFNRVFKKVTKQTPNQYKKSLDVEN